jgi:hypothetical protein
MALAFGDFGVSARRRTTDSHRRRRGTCSSFAHALLRALTSIRNASAIKNKNSSCTSWLRIRDRRATTIRPKVDATFLSSCTDGDPQRQRVIRKEFFVIFVVEDQ